MSVKFEETVTKTTQNVGEQAVEKALEKAENIPGTSGKHPIAAAVGTVLTGGVEMAGTKGYLAVSPLPSLSVSWGPDAMRLFRDGANGGDAM